MSVFLPVFRTLSVISVFWPLLSSLSCGLVYFLSNIFKKIGSLYYLTISDDLHQFTLFSTCHSSLMLFIYTPTILNCIAKIKEGSFHWQTYSCLFPLPFHIGGGSFPAVWNSLSFSMLTSPVFLGWAFSSVFA